MISIELNRNIWNADMSIQLKEEEDNLVELSSDILIEYDSNDIEFNDGCDVVIKSFSLTIGGSDHRGTDTYMILKDAIRSNVKYKLNSVMHDNISVTEILNTLVSTNASILNFFKGDDNSTNIIKGLIHG